MATEWFFGEPKWLFYGLTFIIKSMEQTVMQLQQFFFKGFVYET